MKTATMRIRLVLVSMLLAGYCQAAINPKTLVGMWLFDEGTGKQQKMPSVPVTKVKSRDQNGPEGSSERLCHLKLTTQLLAILTAMRKILTIVVWIKTSAALAWSDIMCGPCGDIILTLKDHKLNFAGQCAKPISHSA
ncbi:MAG: hypothetical protein QGH37_07300 [Candidatus Poribacteria bacterium]|nr:hypothetical protein [Candidatus Poribacteria bacterium]